MACPPSALLLPLAIFLGIAGVFSDDDPAKWSQRSASNNGWVPIETPCESCRNAAEDQDIQATGGFASAALPPPQPQAPSLIWTDTGELRPPPAPIRIQRQEGAAAPLRPLSDTYFTDQRPPPPPVPKGVKSQRDHRFLFNQNLPKQQQFSYIPENQHRLQQNRVVFPSSQVHSQFSDLQTANLQPGGQNGAFFGQQFRPEITVSQQQQLSLRQQQHQPNKQVQIQQQELQQNLQLQNPQKQAKFQSIPHDQFPLIFPPGGLGPPHGFQNPQLQILPVPHSAQSSASQVDLQSVLQHQLQNQIHHQINQQLLGASFVAPLTQFPPSALGHQLQIPIRNPAISPANLQLIPQKQTLQQTHQHLQQTSQPSHPFQSAQKVNQQLELTPSKKLTPTIPPKIETTTISQESTKNAVGSNPEEEVEEEVQLLYVPVEALRQRDRINKEIIQGQTPSVINRNQPERQTSHSFQINHYQENRPLTQNSGQFQENAGIAQASFDHVQTKFPTGKDISNEKERFQNQGFRADQGSASVLREEKHPFAFSPPPPQQFHENIQLEGPRQVINQGEEGTKLFQDGRYHLENLQQEEQQRAVSKQQIQNVRVTTPQYETYSTSRKPSRILEQNGQRIYQGPGSNIGQSFPSHTTTRPSSTTQNQPVPTTQSTQSYVSSTPAPHQPPLSVYMEDIVSQGVSRLSVDDVLRSLNGASTIPVLERPGHRPPRVFVGPSAIRPPQGYAKFELPYLSMLDTNRVERKIDRLPFFVAPLSFQPPPGYAKIPFPAPHVGSVVISSTPVQSTTESVFADEKPPTTSVLPQLVNSLQLSNASPGEGISHPSLNTDVGNVPITSSQRPPLQQVHRQRPQHQQPQRQQFTQHQIHNQESISQGHLQQPLHEHQNVNQYFGQQPFFEQQFVQQQELQQQLFQPQGPEEQVIQHQILSQENSGQRQQPQPQQYQEPQQPSYVLYKTDPPPQITDYTTSSTPPTTTTTTTTTTLAPQTRAPTPHRGRNRHRPSYSQNTDSDYSYRGRGSFRGSSQGETTRQPSTRTRRPWDGRRRPTTSTTEQSTSPEDTSYDSSFNPVSPPNQIVSSTVSSIDQQKDSNTHQNPNIVTQSSIEQQQYVKDDPYSQSSLIDGVSQDGHLHSQGAFVLSAFQHPQVLGDVINGQISRPESPSSFTGIYDGQKGNIGHTFEVISTDDQSSIQVQGPSPPRQHQIISHAGSPEVGFNSNKDTNIPLQNRDIVRNQNLEGGRNNQPGRASNSRGQHNIQQYRQQESPVTTAQNFFQGEIRTVTPDTLGLYQNTGLPGPNRNNGAALRNYNQQPNSIQASVQNVPAQQIFPTQFTPSIEISEEPIHEQSTKHPEVSNSQGSHHPQLFVISTPIPNPIQFVNRTYLNPPTLENPLPIYQSQVYQSQANPVEERRPVAEVVNQGLSSFSGHQENTAQNFQISSNQQGQLVEHTQPQFQSGHQANVKEQPIEDIQPEGEPKRTRFRQTQKVLAGTQSTKHSESSDDIEEPRPRYRQQFKGNVESTRSRQQPQRVRGRFHTTESPSDEESSVPHRSQSFLNQRFRGRQRTSGSTSSQETAQYSDSQGVDHISQKLSYPTQAPQPTFPTEIEDHLISKPQVEHVSESHKADGDISDVDKPQIPGEHLKKPDRVQLSNAQGHHVQAQEFERPANVRSRGRFRGGGERTGNRIRGQGSTLNSQDSSSDAEAQNRYQFQGQRYQQIPRRTPVPENIQEEPQRQFQEDSEKVALSFDSVQNKAPLYQKNEDDNINTGSPILISNAGFNTDSIGLNPVLSQPGIPSGGQATVDEYEQNIPSIENQESAVAPIVTTEPTTTTVGSVKPGRKYGNFATRGLPRRPSHSTITLNAVPSSTSAPETSQPQKVYTVRPARRPVPKTPVNTRGRIRKPTTPTTTTTSTTESPYFLTTSAPVETQAEYSPYDQSTSFGAIRGNFRNRKRPVTVGRRPKPSSSNEVQQEEQEDDSPRLQNSYRQRSRGSSRRVSTLPPERAAVQWRQPEEEQSEPAQISDSSQGFKAAKSSGDYYVASQHNLQPSDFQISLSEEALSSETAPRKLNIPGKINNADPRPVYRHGEPYFSEESQQQEEIHEPRLKYQNPPNRSPTTITQNESEYVYEESNPSFTKTTQQKLPTEEAATGTAGIQPKEGYENQQQDFVINFGGLNTAENSGFIKRDELDSGEETRYFDMPLSNPLKLHGKIPADNEKYTEIRDVPFETNPEIVESQEASDSIDESTNVSEDSKPQTNPKVEEESMEKELKEDPIGSEDNVEDLPAKKVSGRRRGNWVRVRTKGQRRRPGDMLETAESQNLATVSQNLLQFTTPVKAKAATPSVELPITEETPMEKDEEQVPNEDTHTGESFDEEAVDVFSDEETSDLNQEEGFEIQEQPAEEILEVESDEESSTEKDEGETKSDLKDLTIEEEPSSSNKSSSNADEVAKDNENLVLDSDENNLAEEENDIFDNAERKITQGESSTESAEKYANNGDEIIDVTTEEPSEATTEFPTPRVLGTSTTTEISLETEICYRGRCVKTKVDADQVPIE